jgi:hypothetical protein
LPWRQGFDLIARHLESQSLPRAALCALELRCPQPYTPDAFGAFNQEYRGLFEQWGLLVDGYVPAARSNVAPAVVPPAEQSVYGFSYAVPSDLALPSFVLSGAAERADVRKGESSVDALREKTADVMANFNNRLTQATATWSDATAITVYTANALGEVLLPGILAHVGSAAAHGVHWFYARPPVVGLEIEIDVRATRREVRLYE